MNGTQLNSSHKPVVNSLFHFFLGLIFNLSSVFYLVIMLCYHNSCNFSFSIRYNSSFTSVKIYEMVLHNQGSYQFKRNYPPFLYFEHLQYVLEFCASCLMYAIPSTYNWKLRPVLLIKYSNRCFFPINVILLIEHYRETQRKMGTKYYTE